MRHGSLAVGCLVALLSICAPAFGAGAVTAREPVAFAALPGWAEDDHAAALKAFRQSCAAPAGSGPAKIVDGLAAICVKAQALEPAAVSDKAKARAFFEANFQPFRQHGEQPDGLLTGYFEPELDGALKPDKRFTVPILRRPDDLVDVVPPNERAAANAAGKLASMRQTKDGLTPYFTRAEIDAGALKGRGLELLYLDNAVDAYLMLSLIHISEPTRPY